MNVNIANSDTKMSIDAGKYKLNFNYMYLITANNINSKFTSIKPEGTRGPA